MKATAEPTTTAPACPPGCYTDHRFDTDCAVTVGEAGTTNNGPITVTDLVAVDHNDNGNPEVYLYFERFDFETVLSLPQAEQFLGVLYRAVQLHGGRVPQPSRHTPRRIVRSTRRPARTR